MCLMSMKTEPTKIRDEWILSSPQITTATKIFNLNIYLDFKVIIPSLYVKNGTVMFWTHFQVKRYVLAIRPRFGCFGPNNRKDTQK